MDIEKEHSAIIIQRSFRKYLKKINGNHKTYRFPNKSSFMLRTENKFEKLQTETEKVYEELLLFYQNLSVKKSHPTYLATLLNDIDKNLSLLRNITSLDVCQKYDFTDPKYSEEVYLKAKSNHEELLETTNYHKF